MKMVFQNVSLRLFEAWRLGRPVVSARGVIFPRTYLREGKHSGYNYCAPVHMFFPRPSRERPT